MTAPRNFISNIIVPVGKGETLSTVASELQADHVVRSQFLFKAIVVLMRGRNRIGAGDYAFTKPENTWTVAERLVNSEQDLQAVRVTLPEGLTSIGMSEILNSALSTSSPSAFSAVSQFNEAQFLSLASTSEGYLFPDTYLFLPNDTSATVLAVMKNNFNSKFDTILPNVDTFLASTTKSGFDYNENDVVIMASIIEKEAASSTDRRIIAGILWKRLESGQLLEADPTLAYANLLAGQNFQTANALTEKDLASTSPYNTYKYKGLPPTPIDNPGLDSLIDTVTPISTDYWYYLSDSNGVTHYATTYAEQEANQAKYLGN
jgi:UPF0755 protein